MGKKGEITQLSKLIGTLPEQERRAFGQAVNAAKKAVLDAIESRRTSLVDDEIAAELADQSFDPTRTDFEEPRGSSLHPLTIVRKSWRDLQCNGFYGLGLPRS